MKNFEKTILARLESETSARREQLQADAAEKKQRLTEAAAAAETNFTERTFFSREKAVRDATVADRTLSEFDAAVAARSSAEWRAKLSEYAGAVAESDLGGFVESLEPAFAEIAALELTLREHVERITAMATKRAEAARRAEQLADELGIVVNDMRLGAYQFIGGARGELAKRLRAEQPDPTTAANVADWIRY